jgi:tetratricopeptide (TPR) repeat protein
MIRQAEQDEFTVYKARLEKHLYGKQPRLNKRQMRKRSDDDPEKYNQLVVDDENELKHEYENDYRGRVQNRKIDIEFLPMFSLSFEPMRNDVRSNVLFDRHVDELNQQLHSRTIYINNSQKALSETDSRSYFAYIDTLTSQMRSTQQTRKAVDMLLLRAVAFASIQNFESAIDDLSAYLYEDSVCVPALWLRSVCQSRINQFQASEGTNVELKNANVLADLNHALTIDQNNAYLYYNRGCLNVYRKDYVRAIEDFTRAIELDARLAEAYYNRGLCAIYRKQADAGISDLSKAGELGLYTAYSIIKKYRK